MIQSIPNNITDDAINSAIKEIKENGIPARRTSHQYYAVVDGEKFPPKYVISIANKYVNNKELASQEFTAHQAINFLKKKKIKIEENRDAPSFYQILRRFAAQAMTENLKTLTYPKTFADLKVRVSFGNGNKAQVPWIAFLNDIDKVQDGIYPVFLYYLDQQVLILAYGISETNVSTRSWQLNNPESISQYFKNNNLGTPPRYGSSYIYKVYDATQKLDKKNLDEDLLELIDIYNNVEKNEVSSNNTNRDSFKLNDFIIALEETGLRFNSLLVTRLIASLLTKPFVILTGLSGSGKTKLAQAFVQWICNNSQQYCLVPVGADWTNREPLLGYPNALNPEEYIKPDNGALDLILRANSNPSLPHFLILDEMNLSHVERYFADFLSVMESHESISLYTANEKKDVPPDIKWPINLFIIGTVNIDETTNMFSPKVLDRANTIEFRVTEKDMVAFLTNNQDINIKPLVAAGSSTDRHFVKLASEKSIEIQDIQFINETLVDFFKELKKIGAEFGYRSATEILQLIHQLSVLNPTLNTNQKLDIAIMQKLLPKLHGSRRKLCPVLVSLGKLCHPTIEYIEKDIFETDDFNIDTEQILYPMSLEKIARMYRNAVDNGFTSFAEA